MESDDDENSDGLWGSQSKGTSKEGVEKGDSKVILDVFDDHLIQDFHDDLWKMLGNKRSVEFGHTTIAIKDQRSASDYRKSVRYCLIPMSSSTAL